MIGKTKETGGEKDEGGQVGKDRCHRRNVKKEYVKTKLLKTQGKRERDLMVRRYISVPIGGITEA